MHSGYQQGREAFHNDESIYNNPYKVGDKAYVEWREGYEDACAEHVENTTDFWGDIMYTVLNGVRTRLYE